MDVAGSTGHAKHAIRKDSFDEALYENRGMNWFRRWLAGWRGEGPARLVVVLIDGADLALVDRYLGEGLLPHLALVSDVGRRIDFAVGRSFEPPAIFELLRGQRIRTQILSQVPLDAAADLDAICASDRAQQDRLRVALGRRRWRAVVAVFPMLAQLESLFGPTPDAEQRLVLRDVHVRMDEVVGKAMSFVDARTEFLAAIRPRRSTINAPAQAAVFVSRAVSDQPNGVDDLAEVVSQLLDGSARRA